MWRALQGAVDRDDDGDEIVQDETGTAAASNGVIILEWTPVRAGTLSGTIGGFTVRDDGNGNVLNAANGATSAPSSTKATARAR